MEQDTKKLNEQKINTSINEDAPSALTISSKEIAEQSSLDISSAKEAKDVQRATLISLRQKELKNISNFLIHGKKILFIVFLYAIAFSFITTYFINASGLFSIGLASLFQGISYTIFELTNNQDYQIASYWSLYAIVNLPILIFTYKNFTHRFFILTTIFIITNILFGFILPQIIDPTIIIDQFGTGTNSNTRNIGIFLLAAFGGTIYGIVSGYIFKNGGCTGGADPIARFLSRSKGWNIGLFNFAFTGINVLIFTIINDFALPLQNGENPGSFFKIILAPKSLATLTFIGITSFVLNYIFPTKKTYTVTINTELGITISQKLNEDKWLRGHNIAEIKGGNTNRKRYIITMIINNLEFPNLINYIKVFDPKAFITAQPVVGYYGNFDAKEKTKEEELEDRKLYTKLLKEERKRHTELKKQNHSKNKKITKKLKIVKKSTHTK